MRTCLCHVVLLLWAHNILLLLAPAAAVSYAEPCCVWLTVVWLQHPDVVSVSVLGSCESCLSVPALRICCAASRPSGAAERLCGRSAVHGRPRGRTGRPARQ